MTADPRILLLAVIAVALFITRIALVPLIEIQDEQIEMNTALASRLAKSRQTLAYQPQLEKHLESLKPLVLNARKEILLGEATELVNEQKAIQELLQRNDVTLNSFQWSAEVPSSSETGIGRALAALSIEGDFEAFLSLTMAIARRQPFTTIKDFRLRNVSRRGSRYLSGTLTLEIIRSNGRPTE